MLPGPHEALRVTNVVLRCVCRHEAQQQAEQLQAKLQELTAQLEAEQGAHKVRSALSMQSQRKQLPSAAPTGYLPTVHQLQGQGGL